jgi:putative tricarboxylic transport membrane protein
MDVIGQLLLGLGVAGAPMNLAYCLLGVVLGTAVGVLPGVGPVSTIALLLPITFGMSPVPALIMMAGIYYGAQYGGSTTAILTNLPGEVSSVITCLDGYQMAQQGRAATALGAAALGSFVAGCVGTAFIVVAAPLLTRAALMFGAVEQVALMGGGLAAALALSRGSLLAACAMVGLGVFFGLVGADGTTGVQRFTFGLPQLADGIGFATVAIGLYGFAEVVMTLQRGDDGRVVAAGDGALWPRGEELAAASKAVARGTCIGAIAGVLPGSGVMLSSVAAYVVEQKLAPDPSRFGRGAIEGVAAPEAANNAAAHTSFIPLLTLGIPSNAVMAMMLGAMTIHGIVPGPQLATDRPDLFWGVVVSMWIGNILLLILNMPLVRAWAALLRTPYRRLYPAVVLIGCIGVYSINNSTFEVALAAGFGVLGCVLVALGCDRTPFLLGFVLGPLLEENLRRAMVLAHGDATVFLRSPVSVAMLLSAAALIVVSASPLLTTLRARAE